MSNAKKAMKKYLKPGLQPKKNPEAHWKKALPWKLDPTRYLPNYYTYMQIMTDAERALYAKSDIVFVHVPRSGGTSMNTCMQSLTSKNKDFEDSLTFVSDSRHEAAMKYLSEESEKRRMVSGEFAFHACDRMSGRPCAYVLLMRDPYERVVSNYKLCKRHSHSHSHFYCKLNASSVSLVDWAIMEGSPVFRQLLAMPNVCNFLKHIHLDLEETFHIDDEILLKKDVPCWVALQGFFQNALTKEQTLNLSAYVANNMELWFAAVGTLSNFGLYINTLSGIFHLRDQHCTRLHRNKGFDDEFKKNASSVVEMLQELKSNSRVKEALAADLILWERVKEVERQQNGFPLQRVSWSKENND
ncbi:hypothetical protein HOLleu_06443 [Holothuria leucospilota]|uniref:Sulfotransferase n=1 Tax=Holothuria leucospilota TaxID=206669 RepID=A0A9Q1CKX5_HOLLE|nr:hypothetical protein HOLleu_06443 [Holothuria leucospilota]